MFANGYSKKLITFFHASLKKTFNNHDLKKFRSLYGQDLIL